MYNNTQKLLRDCDFDVNVKLGQQMTTLAGYDVVMIIRLLLQTIKKPVWVPVVVSCIIIGAATGEFPW